MLLIAMPLAVSAQSKPVKRALRAGEVLTEIMGTPEKGIPQDLLGRCQCVAIIPGVKKVALGFGGKGGKGVIVCRGKDDQGWTGPSTVRVEGGSVGFQIGVSSTDHVLLIMNKRGGPEAAGEQVHAGWRRIGRGRSRWTLCASTDRCEDERRDSVLLAIKGCVRRRIARGCDPSP